MKERLSKSCKGRVGLLLVVMLWLANVLPALAQEQSYGVLPGEVLVKFKPGTTFTTKAEVGRSIASKAMVNKGGFGYTKIELPTEADVQAVVEELKQDPNVEYAEPVYVRRALGTVESNDEYYTNYQWGLIASGVPLAWDKVSDAQRQNVTVAVLDTGVDFLHPDLQGNLIAGMDIINQDPYPFDFNGHGTHVAGIIGANTNNGIGVAGVADGVKIMPVKILDNGGMGTTADLVEGILWAVEHGADVINMSLGGESPSQYEQEAIQYALDHNVVVVAAVGNESNNWIAGDAYDLDMGVIDNQTSYQSPVGYPAAYPGVIGVGAVDWLDSVETNYGFNVADFSNVGPEVDVVAPGVDIYSTYINDGYEFISGTSQATPFVSGLAALLLAADPSLTYEEVQRVLEQTATDLMENPGQPGWDDYFGAGLIDGQWAFDLNRLKLNLIADDLNDATHVSVTSSVYDYKGALVDTAEAGALWAWNWDDLSQTFVPTPDLQGTVIDAVYGVGNYNFELSVPGVYAMFVGNSSGTYYVGSDVQYVQKRPLVPQANLPAGTFTESQSIALSTQTTGAKIYYTLDGSNPTEESNLYTQPIQLSGSKTVKAIAVMNGAYSTVAEFSYVIDLPYTGGGGGGGGGGGTYTTDTTPSVVTETDGSKTLPISVSDDDVEDLLNSGSEVTIDANSKTDYDNLELSLQGQLLLLAKQKDKKLTIDGNDVNLTFDGDAFGTLKADAGLDLAVKRSTMTNPNGFSLVSSVFDFNLKIDDKAVSQFNKPLSIELNFDADQVENPNKLGVYYFNEKLGQWEYVGGKLVDSNTITFTTQHFSQFAVLEKLVTFKDLTNHWARETIEALVAKDVITGMSDDTFAPEAQVTRAELAVLLARALQLEPASSITFADVQAGNWYADGVSRVQAAGIINGVSDTSFAPNQVVDRQQMATMIMRAYAYKTGKQLDEIITTMELRFSDEGVADSWARRNIVLADATGLMKGYPDGKFMPKATLTRAEAAVVIKRLLDSVE